MLKLGNNFLSEFKTSAALKISLRKKFLKSHTEENMQSTYTQQDLYWEYIKSLYNLLLKTKKDN